MVLRLLTGHQALQPTGEQKSEFIANPGAGFGHECRVNGTYCHAGSPDDAAVYTVHTNKKTYHKKDLHPHSD